MHGIDPYPKPSRAARLRQKRLKTKVSVKAGKLLLVFDPRIHM